MGSPRDIFANDEVMTRTKLSPPQITQFARRHWPGDPQRLALTVAEAVQTITTDRAEGR